MDATKVPVRFALLILWLSLSGEQLTGAAAAGGGDDRNSGSLHSLSTRTGRRSVAASHRRETFDFDLDSGNYAARSSIGEIHANDRRYSYDWYNDAGRNVIPDSLDADPNVYSASQGGSPSIGRSSSRKREKNTFNTVFTSENVDPRRTNWRTGNGRKIGVQGILRKSVKNIIRNRNCENRLSSSGEHDGRCRWGDVKQRKHIVSDQNKGPMKINLLDWKGINPRYKPTVRSPTKNDYRSDNRGFVNWIAEDRTYSYEGPVKSPGKPVKKLRMSVNFQFGRTERGSFEHREQDFLLRNAEASENVNPENSECSEIHVRVGRKLLQYVPEDEDHENEDKRGGAPEKQNEDEGASSPEEENEEEAENSPEREQEGDEEELLYDEDEQESSFEDEGGFDGLYSEDDESGKENSPSECDEDENPFARDDEDSKDDLCAHKEGDQKERRLSFENNEDDKEDSIEDDEEDSNEDSFKDDEDEKDYSREQDEDVERVGASPVQICETREALRYYERDEESDGNIEPSPFVVSRVARPANSSIVNSTIRSRPNEHGGLDEDDENLPRARETCMDYYNRSLQERVNATFLVANSKLDERCTSANSSLARSNIRARVEKKWRVRSTVRVGRKLMGFHGLDEYSREIVRKGRRIGNDEIVDDYDNEEHDVAKKSVLDRRVYENGDDYYNIKDTPRFRRKLLEHYEDVEYDDEEVEKREDARNIGEREEKEGDTKEDVSRNGKESRGKSILGGKYEAIEFRRLSTNAVSSRESRNKMGENVEDNDVDDYEDDDEDYDYGDDDSLRGQQDEKMKWEDFETDDGPSIMELIAIDARHKSLNRRPLEDEAKYTIDD